MNILRTGCLTLTTILLLAACGKTIEVEKLVEVEKIVEVESDVPFVARATRPDAPNCSTPTFASMLGDLRHYTGKTFVQPPATLTIQSHGGLPDSVQRMLFDTKSLLNTYYYGYSTVDLQALHKKYEGVFKTGREGSLSQYPVTPDMDPTMRQYLREIGDMHSGYLSAELLAYLKASAEQEATTAPSFGFTHRVVPGQDGAVITDVHPDGSAMEQGLSRGDVILEIDGQALVRSGNEAETSAAYAAIIDAALAKTSVPVKLSRAGQQFSVTLTRAELDLEPVPWGTFIPGLGGETILYLRIPTFLNFDTGPVVHAYVAAAKAGGATGAIIDLRDNPGGYVVSETIAAGAFAPNVGSVVETIDADDVTFAFVNGALQLGTVCEGIQSFAISGATTWTARTAILVNGMSASASESVAHLLSEGVQAKIIGEPTFGVMNTTVNFFEMTGGRGLAVSTGRSKSLSGTYMPEHVEPDIAAPDDLAQLAAGNDLAMNAALDYLSE